LRAFSGSGTKAVTVNSPTLRTLNDVLEELVQQLRISIQGLPSILEAYLLRKIRMLSILLQIGGLIPLLIGFLVVWHVIRPQKTPADSSNRINKIRLLWFVLTREDLFVGTFPWLKRDEKENV
jgi:hypothetical protein